MAAGHLGLEAALVQLHVRQHLQGLAVVACVGAVCRERGRGESSEKPEACE